MDSKICLGVTVPHHKACQVMPNSDPKEQIFFYPDQTAIIDSFSCISFHFSLLLVTFNKRKLPLLMRENYQCIEIRTINFFAVAVIHNFTRVVATPISASTWVA